MWQETRHRLTIAKPCSPQKRGGRYSRPVLTFSSSVSSCDESKTDPTYYFATSLWNGAEGQQHMADTQPLLLCDREDWRDRMFRVCLSDKGSAPSFSVSREALPQPLFRPDQRGASWAEGFPASAFDRIYSIGQPRSMVLVTPQPSTPFAFVQLVCPKVSKEKEKRDEAERYSLSELSIFGRVCVCWPLPPFRFVLHLGIRTF